MDDIIERARLFATAAHAAVKQVRKYTNEDYIVHPAAVVEIVKSDPHTDVMASAAWLHDTIEDTGVTIGLIRAEFGAEVAELVYWLTDQSKPEDGNREARKAIDRFHCAAAPADAQTIKLADLIDNTLTIEARDPDFYRVYRREKELLLDVLTLGDPALMRIARDQIAEKTVDA